MANFPIEGASQAFSLYEKAARSISATAGAFRLPQAANWISRRLSKSIMLLGIELFVALSLTVSFYFIVKSQCNAHWHNPLTFSYLSQNSNASRDGIFSSWRTRILGPAMSGWILDKTAPQAVNTPGSEKFQEVFGLYHTGWVLLTFLALILARRDALLIILAVFGGLMLNLSEPTGPRYYPWDMPSLFFFTAAVLCYDKGRMCWLMVMVCVGGLFKETTLCCGLFILFSERWVLWQRFAAFAATIAARMLINKCLMAHYGVQAQLLAMGNTTDATGLFTTHYLFDNIKLLFSAYPRQVIFVNAGSLLIALLIPWRNRREVVLKLVFFIFVLGQFQYGVIDEFRIWYELLPLSWMMLSEFIGVKFALATEGVEKPAATFNRGGRISGDALLKGSYWLVLATLLIVALGVFVAANGSKVKEPESANQKQAENLAAIQKLIFNAQNGDVEAQYNLGLTYQDGNDYNGAIQWYLKAAEQGHAQAQNGLGTLLILVQQDYVGGIFWLNQAANLANADAENNLGVAYLNGTGVKKNQDKAAQYFLKAAQQGHLTAQKLLGKMYQDGTGVPTDKLQAYKWLKLAALQGDEKATNDLQVLSATLTPEQIAAGEKLVQAK